MAIFSMPRSSLLSALILAAAGVAGVAHAQQFTPNTPSGGWNCGSWPNGMPPQQPDDFLWLTIDICNFLADKEGMKCCFADPYGQTKEAQDDIGQISTGFGPKPTTMTVRDPNPVG